jgi:hypothetical protein
MRFMLIVKADAHSEAGAMPPKDLVESMGRFNEEMAKAGVMLAGEGLQPSSTGARVRFAAGRPTVTDGPFPHATELAAGFWIVQVASRDEAIAWARRVPFVDGEIEVRRIFETSDFPADVLSPEAAAREEALRAELGRRAPR